MTAYAHTHSMTMATRMKHFSLVLLVSVLAATCFSFASASDTRAFGGGRKLLQRLSGTTLPSTVASSQEVRDLEILGFHTDYAPATTHLPANDYPSPGDYSSTVGFHTDYAPATTNLPAYDYPSPGEYGSKTVGFHTDYAPATTHRPDYDYSPPAIPSSIET